MRYRFITCCLLAFIMSDSSASAADVTSDKTPDHKTPDTPNVDVWIGTSSSPPSRGIYHCTLNTHTGKLTDPTLAAEMDGPGFLAMHPSEKVVYAVGGLDGKDVVAAYKIEGEKLTLINSLETGDGNAAHVAVDQTGKMLLTAQYSGGSVAAFSLADDGSLKEQTDLIKHQGSSGVVPGRQSAPHAHWVGFSPDNRFAFVPDLGLDKVVIYKVDPENAKLTHHGYGKVPSGGGPRHMKFHPSGKFIFVLNELSLGVTVFDYDAEAGTMTPKQTIPTVSRQLLAKEKAKSGSEIRVHPSGQFVFTANRGHDTVTVFRVSQSTGQLSVIEVENARAVTPRNINLDPTGNWLLTAGQDSHTLASFNVDGSKGELTYNQSIVIAPSAICVLFQHE